MNKSFDKRKEKKGTERLNKSQVFSPTNVTAAKSRNNSRAVRTMSKVIADKKKTHNISKDLYDVMSPQSRKETLED